jgi:anti-sigma-K factor RskA
MSPDVHALTGAYVLDAVSDLERVDFERHLAECDACRQEVNELRETATRLGQSAVAAPPPALKARVMANISQVRQLPPDVAVRRVRPASPRWALRLTTAAAAALLVVAGVLGVLLVQQRSTLDDTRQYADSLSAILQAEDAQVARAASSAGGSATVVASRTLDRALVLTDGMPPPPADRVYQAWLITPDGQAQSAGLLSDGRLAVPSLATANSIGLSEEPSGGSAQPSAVLLQVSV